MFRLLLNHNFNLSLLDKQTRVIIPHVSKTCAEFWNNKTSDINSLIVTDVNRTEINNVNIIFNILTEDCSLLATWRLMGKIYLGNELDVEIDFCTELLLNSACYMLYICILTHIRTLINTYVYKFDVILTVHHR